MKYPTFRFVYDRRGQANDKKKGEVMIEVYFNRKRRYIHTPVKVYPNQWDKNKKVINSLDCISYNLILDGMLSKCNQIVASLAQNDRPFSFSDLDSVANAENQSGSFIEFVKNRIAKRNGIAESTRKQQIPLISALDEFKKIEFFSDVKRENLLKFDEWLHDKNLAQSTVFNYHKRMKIYISEAIKEKLISENPYDGIKISRGRTNKRKYLTDSELSQIRKVELPTESLKNARDLFLFQCYTGMAYSDMAKFDFFNDSEKRGDNYVIVDRRKKTDTDFYIVLMSPAMEILKKHDYVLPVISNQKYNVSLKVISLLANVTKAVTSHVARHTFAVFALNNGVPIEVVSKMLGHTSIRTTQEYAKIVNKQIEQGYMRLERLIEK